MTTLDFDFCYRKTPTNARKLKALARELGAVLSMPSAPLSDRVRLEREDMSLQVDFLAEDAIGVNFAFLRSGSAVLTVGGATVRVADLRHVAAMKRRAGRPKDKAALYAIEATIEEQRRVRKNRRAH